MGTSQKLGESGDAGCLECKQNSERHITANEKLELAQQLNELTERYCAERKILPYDGAPVLLLAYLVNNYTRSRLTLGLD